MLTCINSIVRERLFYSSVYAIITKSSTHSLTLDALHTQPQEVSACLYGTGYSRGTTTRTFATIMRTEVSLSPVSSKSSFPSSGVPSRHTKLIQLSSNSHRPRLWRDILWASSIHYRRSTKPTTHIHNYYHRKIK